MDITQQLESDKCEEYARELCKIFVGQLHEKTKQIPENLDASAEFIRLLTIRNWALRAFGYQVTDSGSDIEPFNPSNVDDEEQLLRSLAKKARNGDADAAGEYLRILAARADL